MSDKTEWEINQEAATECWKSMTPNQQQAMLAMLKAWVPIRTRVSELCSLDYDDLRAVDDAWWGLKRALVDKDVDIKEWDFQMPRNVQETLVATTKEDLDEQIEWYLTRYHPLGYDTRVTRTTHNPETNKYTAVMSRWDSCDQEKNKMDIIIAIVGMVILLAFGI